MKKFCGLLFALSMVFSLSGCGGPDEAASMIEDAEQTDIEAYQEAIAAESAAMDAAAPGNEPAR